MELKEEKTGGERAGDGGEGIERREVEEKSRSPELEEEVELWKEEEEQSNAPAEEDERQEADEYNRWVGDGGGRGGRVMEEVC